MLLSDICLSDVCLSRTSDVTREQRGLGGLKLAQRQPTSHVTWTLLSRSKGQRSSSPGRFTHRRVGASGSCSGGCGNVLAVRNYVAICSAARGASAPMGEERGGGISWWPPAYSLLFTPDFSYPYTGRPAVTMLSNCSAIRDKIKVELQLQPLP